MRKKIGETETEEQKRQREIVEGIAHNISALAGAVKALLNGPLKQRTLVVLLASSSRLSQRQVEDVLKALADMDKDWLR